MHFLLCLPATIALNVVSPYPRGVYDAKAARNYYSSRPLQVASRALELVTKSAGLGVALLGDALSHNMDERADQRAARLPHPRLRAPPVAHHLRQSADAPRPGERAARKALARGSARARTCGVSG